MSDTAKLQQLRSELQALYQRLTSEKREEWNRSLPFEELLIDRWERAKTLGFGEGSSIYSNSLVFGDVQVGKETWVGPYTILEAHHAPIKIGSSCNISTAVQVYSHDSIQRVLTAGKAAIEKGAVTIGDCTYIGPNAVVARGVTIGDHCVIGANSLVNKDIPAFSFAAGNPCKILGKIRKKEDNSYEIIETSN